MLEKLFHLSKHKTNASTETIAGMTTFLTMAYIIFVNPSILAQTGMDKGAVFVATCLAAAIGSFIMGFYANYPVALAPGMGLNAFFTYTVVLQMGYTWQVALAAVCLSGIVFVLLSIFKIREWIINAIPNCLKIGISAGIGVFLALIALQKSGIIIPNQATLVSIGHFNFQSAMAALGFFLTIGLTHLRVKGSVMIAIIVVTIIALLYDDIHYAGIVSMPPSLMPTLLQLDFSGALHISMIAVIFAFLFVDLFDTAGTLVAVAHKADLLDEQGNLPKLKKALLADSFATVIGTLLGTSSTTSYIESASGVAEGGRTGMTAVVVGCLFLLALFFAPLAGMVPAYATAGALFYVAILMMGGLTQVDWRDITEAAPVVVVCLLTPLTYSIANGIALGFISYVAIKLFSGKLKEIPISVFCIALVFGFKFALV